MKQHILGGMLGAAALVLLFAFPCLADTLRVRVSTGNDDGTEYLVAGCTYAAGRVRLGDDYLYPAAQDCSGTDPNTLTGLRFNTITIPRGAIITAARLELVMEDSTCGNGINWSVAGENVDNAGAFTTTSGSLSARKAAYATVAATWQNDGDRCSSRRGRTTVSSPEIKTVIQQIVNRAGWNSGNSMVFFLSGAGQRTVYSYNQKSSRAPLLHIDYLPTPLPTIAVDPVTIGLTSFEGVSPAAGSFVLTNTGNANLAYSITDSVSWLSVSPASGTLAPGAIQTMTVTFVTPLLAPGTHEATITVSGTGATNTPVEIPVSLTVQPAPHSSVCGEVPIYTENLVNPAILILLDTSGSMTTLMDLVDPDDTNNISPDLTAIVQAIINRAGWAEDNDMSFIITGNGSGARRGRAYDSSSASAPVLTVDYTVTENGVDVDYDDETFPVVGSSDDAHQSGSTMYLTRTSLQLGGAYSTGLRFAAVSIPRGATIRNATIRFVPSFSDSSVTTVTIYGEAIDDSPTFTTASNNISGRTKTAQSVSWTIPSWSPPTQESRLKIAQDVLSTLVADRSIAWGFGSWTGNFSSSIDYTKIYTGCKFNDDTHQAKLQSSIAAVTAGGTTPLVPAMQAAQKYFAGTKADLDTPPANYVPLECQPKFLILITDGLGNTATTEAGVTTESNNLATKAISGVGIGFGLDDATQLNILASIANAKGKLSDTDSLYPLHEEVNDVGVPFLAQNKAALETAMQEITTSIKTQVFYGSTPAPTTSASKEDLIVNAQFTAGGWKGNLLCTDYDPATATLGTVQWTASTVMPTDWKDRAYTVSAPAGSVAKYTDATLASDNYLCKPLGDIINSTPVIVDMPPFYYPFDAYSTFRAARAARETMIYVGSNDGALHAFKLADGTEQWRFYPYGILSKLNQASDPTKDMCSTEYCHEYLVDGSPVAADIFDGANWKTVLLSGLRRGGAAYFALDITGGKKFDDTDTANQTKYLWQFTDSELGQSWVQPEVYRLPVKNSTGTTWGAFWGSGYAENPLNQPAKEAYLYGVIANDASALWKNAAGAATNRIKFTSASLPDDAIGGVTVADLDDDYKGDRLYAGNLYGTMARVTDIQKDNTPVISTLFHFDRVTPDRTTPIRAKPVYAYHSANDVWVYFGTGRYEVQADKVTSSQQYFFGLQDNLTNPTHTLDTLTNAGTVFRAEKKTDAASGKDFRIITGSTTAAPPYSWALELENVASTGATERVITDALVLGGVVFFTTYTPSADVCEGIGEAWLFALDYATGKPPADVIFDINGDGAFDQDDVVTDSSGNTYAVAGISLGNDMASNPVSHKGTIVVGTKSGGPIATKVNLPRMRPKLRSWWENP